MDKSHPANLPQKYKKLPPLLSEPEPGKAQQSAHESKNFTPHPEIPYQPILLAPVYIPPSQKLEQTHLDNLIIILKEIAGAHSILIGGDFNPPGRENISVNGKTPMN